MHHQPHLTSFKEYFSENAQGVAIAPGRVNLIGEFTDYNNGFVLPCALNYATRVYFQPRNDNTVHVISLQYPNENDQFELNQNVETGNSQWGNYVRAVVYTLQQRGFQLTGVNLLIDSSVPQGSGLSSSAALEVAIAGVFNQLDNLSLSTTEIAIIGQQAENEFMHCQCGIMDQLVSANGKSNCALLIDCQDLSTENIAIPDDLNLLIINSNYPRRLVESEYNQRRIDCESAASKMSLLSLRDANLAMLEEAKQHLSQTEFKRARHVITENERVLQAKQALKNNDMTQLITLMSASHNSLKTDFEVTVPPVDGLVDICQTALAGRGAVRMTGGGFGGAIICLCRKEDITIVEQAVTEQYFSKFNLQADIIHAQAGTGLTVSLL